MEMPIAEEGQATPAWLTGRLRANGHLGPSQDVTEVRVVERRPSWANTRVCKLEVEYAPAGVDLPRRYVLKTGGSDGCVDLEAWFHHDVVGHMENPPTVPCFDALCDWDAGRAHLLFEDVSATHYHGKGRPGPRLRAESERVVDAFAPFHAFWWDHPFLGDQYGSVPKEDTILFYQGVESYGEKLGRFADRAGDRFSRERRALYEKMLAAFPFKDLQGQSRLTSGKNLTLIHGDVQHENNLLPKDPRKDPTYLIDWGLWEMRLGTDDIANLAHFGFCDPHAGLTRALVRRYYDGLVEHGVTGYAWEECWHDYRASTVRCLFLPIGSGANGRSLDYCLRNMERALASFGELGCAELLD